MSTIVIPPIILLITSLITISSINTNANDLGFTTSLIRRDSPFSPTHNPSLDRWGQVRNTIHRSISRAKFVTQSSSSSYNVHSQVLPNKGEYLMEMFIGTPGVKQLVIPDTGSDLIWLQCQPCVNCYDQKIPIFNPRKSSTYKVWSCKSSLCNRLDYDSRRCSSRGACTYEYKYGDQSHTYGDLATETITFNLGKNNRDDQTNKFISNIGFGCGHDNNGSFTPPGSGVVGLGGGPLSFVSQINSPKFSYCLIPLNKAHNNNNLTSKISFGTQGEVSGRGVSSIPFVKKKTPDTYYYLTLKGISVGSGQRPQIYSKYYFQNAQENEQGNIIIDSGTTLTFLPPFFYDDLISGLDKQIRGQKVEDPMGVLELCYKTKNGGRDLNIPTVTAYFEGADWELKSHNTFVQVDAEVVCAAFLPVEDGGVPIFGNVAQADFLVGYDIVGAKLSFKPVDCTKLV